VSLRPFQPLVGRPSYRPAADEHPEILSLIPRRAHRSAARFPGSRDPSVRRITTVLDVALLGRYISGRGEISLAHHGTFTSWKRHPHFFPLQGEPRFEALLNDPKNNAPLF
jgi:hypothetical protein